MKEYKIKLSEQDVKDLKSIRDYFIENDKTIFEHKSYSILNNLIKKL